MEWKVFKGLGLFGNFRFLKGGELLSAVVIGDNTKPGLVRDRGRYDDDMLTRGAVPKSRSLKPLEEVPILRTVAKYRRHLGE